jgi:succinate-semialdehyde dehydrogenase/glutarate-semialdehyde dehydrogenase
VLTDDPRVRKFTFTGSTAVGSALAARCMATVKRISLELGGNAPVIVFDDADIGKAVDGVIAAKFRNAGQTCVCANRIYVQRGCYDAFVDALQKRVAALRIGSGLADDSDLGPLIDARAVAKVERHVADALATGGRLLAGGGRGDAPGSFYQPTLIADVAPHALMCSEETFGPVAGVTPFMTEKEALALANSAGGLAAYFFTSDHRRIVRVSEQLEAGMIGVNTGMISTATAPVGGIKQSGIGREGSRYGLDEYLELKLLCDDVGGGE